MNNTQKQIVFTLCFFILLGLAVCILYFAGLLPNSSASVAVSNPMADMVIGSADAPSTSVQPAEVLPDDSEPEVEAETEATEAPKETQYYSFVTVNRHEILHVRETPSMESPVIARLAPGTKGYVLERGPAWSLIVTGNIKGYSYNEYLDMTEIEPEELPEEYRQ